MEKETIKTTIEQALEQRPELFLLGWSVSDTNDIEVVIDGDSDVTIEDIVDISRKIERSELMDREGNDFSLSVLSAGADSPISFPRQWKKHIGRTLEVENLSGQKTEAELTAVSDSGISLSWQARENKPIGKGKRTVHKQLDITFGEIKKATVKLKY